MMQAKRRTKSMFSCVHKYRSCRMCVCVRACVLVRSRMICVYKCYKVYYCTKQIDWSRQNREPRVCLFVHITTVVLEYVFCVCVCVLTHAHKGDLCLQILQGLLLYWTNWQMTQAKRRTKCTFICEHSTIVV